MSRKQKTKLAFKLNQGFRKKMLKAEIEEWERLLEENQHHILKLHLEPKP